MNLYGPNEESAERAYEKLKGANPAFAVYRRKDVPAHLHFNENPRTGDPVIVVQTPVAVRATPESYGPDHPPNLGNHGWDPQILPEMKAIFFADGPDIRSGVTLPSFENVNVYPLITKILGLETPTVDGQPSVLAPVLSSESH